MGYSSKPFTSATITSHAKPLSGQEHRCSLNFRLSEIDSATFFRMLFPENIRLCLKVDKSLAIDPNLFESIKSGDRLLTLPNYYSYYDAVYIADVTDKDGKPFDTDFIFEITII